MKGLDTLAILNSVDGMMRELRVFRALLLAKAQDDAREDEQSMLDRQRLAQERADMLDEPPSREA